jgi:hypothetical protein
MEHTAETVTLQRTHAARMSLQRSAAANIAGTSRGHTMQCNAWVHEKFRQTGKDDKEMFPNLAR